MGGKMVARERSGGGPLCLPPSSGRNMEAIGSMGAIAVTGCQELDEVHAGSTLSLNLTGGVAVQTTPVDGGMAPHPSPSPSPLSTALTRVRARVTITVAVEKLGVVQCYDVLIVQFD